MGERVFSGVRGGILAHTMGYGKTAIIIALIHCTCTARPDSEASGAKRQKLATERRVEKGLEENSADLDLTPAGSTCALCTDATLIITPDNLFHQWILEFKKFLGSDTDQLRLLPIQDMREFQQLSCRDVQEADVVIISSTFFLSKEYQHYLSKVAACCPDATAADKYAEIRNKFDNKRRRDMLPNQFVLEAFHWQRVVFDEFHKCVGDTHRHSASWRALHEI